MANARDFGAIGVPFTATCATQASTPVVTFSGSLPAGLIVGSGIGIVGAGATDVNSIRYFPTPTHRARVTAINGLQVTLDAAPAVTAASAQVYCDDSLPIQAAIDATTDGEVYLPPGTYLLGVPDAKNNAPLFLRSGVTLRGAGSSLTTLKVCDRAAQIPHALGSRAAYFYGVLDAAWQYPHASAIVNAHHTMWHRNQPWDVPHLANDPLLVTDVNVGVRDLSIDGNCDNQPANYVRGNMTEGVIADPRAFVALAEVNVEGGSLVVGHTYYVVVTYLDSLGRESTGRRNSITLTAGHNAIQLTMLTPPSGAVGQRIYVKDYESDPADRERWPYADWISDATLKAQWAQLWEVIDLPFKAAGAQVMISAHAEGTTYAPGSGGIGFASACNSTGIFFDNVRGALVENVNIKNFVVDGYCLAYIEQFDNQPAHPTEDVTFRNMIIQRCSRGAGGITAGNVHRILHENVRMFDCFWGVDFEPVGGATGPIEDITFRRCSFSGFFQGSSGGLVIVSRENTPIHRFLVDDCDFEDSFFGISCNNNDLTITIQNSRFRNNRYAAITANACARGLVDACLFEFNGRSYPPPPDNLQDMGGYGAALLAPPLGNTDRFGFPIWQLSNNRIVFEPDAGIWPINILQTAASVLLADNTFEMRPRYVGQVLSGLMPPIALPSNASAYVTAYGNVGDVRFQADDGATFVQIPHPPEYSANTWPTMQPLPPQSATHDAGVAAPSVDRTTHVDPEQTENQIKNFFKIY